MQSDDSRSKVPHGAHSSLESGNWERKMRVNKPRLSFRKSVTRVMMGEGDDGRLTFLWLIGVQTLSDAECEEVLDGICDREGSDEKLPARKPSFAFRKICSPKNSNSNSSSSFSESCTNDSVYQNSHCTREAMEGRCSVRG